jgi:hypothetical protein
MIDMDVSNMYCLKGFTRDLGMRVDLTLVGMWREGRGERGERREGRGERGEGRRERGEGRERGDRREGRGERGEGELTLFPGISIQDIVTRCKQRQFTVCRAGLQKDRIEKMITVIFYSPKFLKNFKIIFLFF